MSLALGLIKFVNTVGRASCLLIVLTATGVVWQGAWISSGDHQAHCKQDACRGQKLAEDSLGSTAVLPEQQPALGRCCNLEGWQAQGELQYCHAITSERMHVCFIQISCMLMHLSQSILALAADKQHTTL